MFKTEILADRNIGTDVPGNKMTLEAELVYAQPNDSSDQDTIGVALTFNTAHDGEQDTEVYFQLPLNVAEDLAISINEMIKLSYEDRIEILSKMVDFKNAQLACVKGAIGGLRITKIADSDRGNIVGFGFYTLEYLDDQADSRVMHTVENIECYVPFTEEDQYEWLRTLVGGNHQYTTEIQVQLVGFTLQEVRDEFNAHLENRALKGFGG